LDFEFLTILPSLSVPSSGWQLVCARNHQILVSNPQVECPTVEAFALVKPLGPTADWQCLRAVAQRDRLLIKHRLDHLARCFDAKALPASVKRAPTLPLVFPLPRMAAAF
jgi:hypothetical protein